MDYDQAHIKNEFGGDESLEDAEDGAYRPRPQLPKPFVVMRSLQYLMNGLENGTIDVNPEYQRELVWTADRMTGLVNSLMENFYVPPIILNKKRRSVEDGGAPSDTLTCVDGKQRLSSVRAFIKGMIPCHDHREEKWWFCDDQSSNRRKRILSEQMQMQFLAKEFVSFEFTDLSPEQEEDLFARVQMGVQLSIAERMRAQSGPWQELARLFVDDFPSIYSLMKERARAKDFQLTLSCFSQIVEVMHRTASNESPVLKTNHSHLTKFLNNKDAVDDGLRSHLASVWNTLKDLVNEDPNTFTNEKKTLVGVQSFAPVEMVAVTVLISKYSDIRNNQQLLDDIRRIRGALREHFIDLRLNISTWKFVWDLMKDLGAIRETRDRSTINHKQSWIPEPRDSSEISITSRVLPALSAKGGQMIAKTIPSTGQQSQTPVTTKKDKILSNSQLGAHPVKRRRTSSQPTDREALATAGGLMETGISTMPDKQLAGSKYAKRLFASMPMQSAPQVESTTLAVPSSATAPSLSATVSVTQTPHDHNTEYHSSFYAHIPTAQWPPLERRNVAMTPGEARRKRVSELNSYRAPAIPISSPARPASTARMGSSPTTVLESTGSPFPICPKSTPTAPMSSQAQTTVVSASSTVSNAQKTSKGTLKTRTALGAFAPSYIDTQWEGITRSVSPKANAKSGRPTLPEHDDVIDFTRDTEEERQSLLAAFKSRSSVGVQGHSGTKLDH